MLNLAEFMEHCEKGPLPIETTLLGEQAVKCRAYAKALHYKEDEFHREPSKPVLEALIQINNKLGRKEAATGLLEWGNDSSASSPADSGDLSIRGMVDLRLQLRGNDGQRVMQVFRLRLLCGG